MCLFVYREVKEDCPKVDPALKTLREKFPQQKWIVLTDYDDDKWKCMRKDLDLNNAKVKDHRDVIYRMNVTQIKEKMSIYVESTLSPKDPVRASGGFEGKQAILLVHHTYEFNYAYMVPNAKEMEKNPELTYRVYRYEIEGNEKEKIRNDFENGRFQFLLATPNMYAVNDDFKYFFHDQIIKENILIGV